MRQTSNTNEESNVSNSYSRRRTGTANRLGRGESQSKDLYDIPSIKKGQDGSDNVDKIFFVNENIIRRKGKNG